MYIPLPLFVDQVDSNCIKMVKAYRSIMQNQNNRIILKCVFSCPPSSLGAEKVNKLTDVCG